jgi:hypothetical protein
LSIHGWIPLTAQIELINIDGYLADLPLASFVANLPFTSEAQQHAQAAHTMVPYPTDDFPPPGDHTFPSTTDMDPQSTSALRDAIFSMTEGAAGHHAHHDPEHLEGSGIDPHLALLDLSHAMPEGAGDLSLQAAYPPPCAHFSRVPHLLWLLAQNPLEQKEGAQTPHTLALLSPLSRSLRLIHALITCPTCAVAPSQTLCQLALLSRTTTILTFPPPPVTPSTSHLGTTVHGARLAGTGVSDAIESHIVAIIWDSWRSALRDVFAAIERKAQEVITHTAVLASEGAGNASGSAETQRAGLMFQGMTRLRGALAEVEVEVGGQEEMAEHAEAI